MSKVVWSPADVRPQVAAALERARGWLDRQSVDPIELRKAGIKGKKKLTELLDAYYRVVRHSPKEQWPQDIRTRVAQLTAVTANREYHDLLAVTDAQFDEDVLSYLRTAYLMDRFGLNTVKYRKEIGKIADRMNRRMSARGANQQRAFHTYYGHFGLKEPFPLDRILIRGLIARRPPIESLTLEDAYQLSHDVLAEFDYGDKPDTPLLADQAVLAYLRDALPVFTRRYSKLRNPDIVAELVECMWMLRFVEDEPAFANGILYLLDAQNPDGSWGDYEDHRIQLGDYIVPAYYLHTTQVAIAALAPLRAGDQN